jgi:hypothetical protein
MKPEQKDERKEIDPYSVWNFSEDDHDEGPGFGVWISAIIWTALILGVLWAWFIWRNT